MKFGEEKFKKLIEGVHSGVSKSIVFKLYDKRSKVRNRLKLRIGQRL